MAFNKSIYTVFKYPSGLAEMASQGIIGKGWISDDGTLTIARPPSKKACEHEDHPDKPTWWNGPWPHLNHEKSRQFTEKLEFCNRDSGE